MEKDVMKMSVDEFKKWYCPSIYFLIKNNNVVYVGQSKAGLARISAHISNKDFNEIVLIPADESNLNEIEAEFIIEHNPIYNKCLPQNERYKTRKNICIDLDIDTYHFKRLKPIPVFKKYYDINNIRKLLLKESLSE